jgi:hypothetical protein
MRRFSSVRPWPGGLLEPGDFVPCRGSAVLIGAGARLPASTFGMFGVSFTIGEY